MFAEVSRVAGAGCRVQGQGVPDSPTPGRQSGGSGVVLGVPEVRGVGDAMEAWEILAQRGSQGVCAGRTVFGRSGGAGG